MQANRWHPRFSQRSIRQLETVDPRLARVLNVAVAKRDFTVIIGHRGREAQEEAYRNGKSKARFGQSLHNTLPSRAVDIAPTPIDWDDTQAFRELAAVILETAREQGVEIRWGGDWDRDGDTADNRFNDLPHFELV